jgi:mono/diheme cytochrome c family protein
MMTLCKVLAVAAFCSFSLRMTGQTRAELKASIERGKIVYEQNCLACHQADASGVPNLAPSLIKASFVTGDKIRLINIVLKGLKDVDVNGENYDNPMPAFAILSDKEVADVLSYVRNNFSNRASGIKPEEVSAVRTGKK